MLVFILTLSAATVLVAAAPAARELWSFDICITPEEIVLDLAEGFERGEA